MSYLQAIVIALVQGVTELFPISSLGHSVLIPAWIGGSWETLVTQSSQQNSSSSFYLAYIVALHCATALALFWYFRTDWVRIIRGWFRSAGRSVRERRLSIDDADERLAWMIVVATIPVGIVGIALEHGFRTLFAKPISAAIFLFLNGFLLLAGERFRRRSIAAQPRPRAEVSSGAGGASAASATGAASATSAASAGVGNHSGQAAEVRVGGRTLAELRSAKRSDARISRLSMTDALVIGSMQIFALIAGVSRSGATMVGGLWRGLDHEDGARFAFLLATPVIFAAGLLKLPSLAGSAGAHIHGQVIVGAIVCALAAYASVRFLMRYFETRTLTPFAIYCLVFGFLSIVRFH